MVRANTRVIGDGAEQLAFRYLRKRGLLPVTRNFRCRHGEIDLIMLDRDCLVFVEVRYRSAGSYSEAVQTVNAGKQRKIARAAAMFLATRRGYSNHTARFDVVGVDRNTDGQISVDWVRDAFRL